MKSRAIIISIIVLAALLAGGGYALYRLGMQRGMAAAPVASSEKKVLYWHDPMVPGQKFDKPGKSPFMDMQLVPVYAEEGADEGKVSISPRVQQNLGVRIAEVTKGSLGSALQASGSVAFNERDVALVQARSNGFVERLYVRAPLDPVRKGQPLLELYVPDWIAAQEEYLSVKRMGTAPAAAGLLDAARQRMRLAGMSEPQIRQVEASGKLSSRVTIVAPTTGVVTELSAREGMTVMSGAPLFRINGLATVWVDAEVPEAAVAQLRPGLAVEASTPAFPDTFKGKVETILPQVNRATRTVQARIALANPSGRLLPGMFATVHFAPPARRDVLLVPSEAVIQTGTRSVVMVALGDGKFAPAEVETGAEANGQTEIRKGLEAGQKVVASGQFLIDSEASLKGSAARMGELPPAPAGAHP
jgi:Cu(I)/Ag(I) efflux system membrane fusion protein